MPYYKEINLLFIHIPKTGGTTFETYLKKKYKETLYIGKKESLFLPKEHQNVSPQHQTYQVLKKYKDLCNIDFNENLKIITILRNPYHRLISDLFWFHLIKKDDEPEEIFNIIKNKYLDKNIFDNHNIPQYKFLIDENNELLERINICKTEKLTKDLHEYGFTDYEGFPSYSTYYNYLNMDIVNLINEYYKNDFEYFNYKKINDIEELNKLKKKDNIFNDYNNLLKKNTLEIIKLKKNEEIIDKLKIKINKLEKIINEIKKKSKEEILILNKILNEKNNEINEIKNQSKEEKLILNKLNNKLNSNLTFYKNNLERSKYIIKKKISENIKNEKKILNFNKLIKNKNIIIENKLKYILDNFSINNIKNKKYIRYKINELIDLIKQNN